MSDLCRGKMDVPGGRQFRCIAVSPALFEQHKPRGSTKGDSDINPDLDHGPDREIGFTRGIVQSVRLNSGRLVDGLKPKDQYVRDISGPWRLRRANEY
jgi:hypothetical protein